MRIVFVTLLLGFVIGSCDEGDPGLDDDLHTDGGVGDGDADGDSDGDGDADSDGDGDGDSDGDTDGDADGDSDGDADGDTDSDGDGDGDSDGDGDGDGDSDGDSDSDSDSDGDFEWDGDYAEKGAYAVSCDTSSGPGGDFTVCRPKVLGGQGEKHPIVTWGNGTGMPAAGYTGLYQHLASHGFVVIASHSVMTGNGQAMLNGARWVIEQGEDSSSVFFDAVDGDAVGATGHSQGGGGAINAGTNKLVKCTVPLAPSVGKVYQLKGPMFLVAGSKDTTCSPGLINNVSYSPSNVSTIFGTLKGADHFTFTGALGAPTRYYLTAWFRLHLMGESDLADLFYGPDCGLCTDPDWNVKRKKMDNYQP